jgi:uncharacterized damage-inducible protein DinB
MTKTESNLSKPFLAQAQRVLKAIYWPRIARCLRLLSQEEIWWRPNAGSNSVGNLVLHLNGNVRQWIIAGLGGAPDTRQRDLEFQERGPMSRRALLAPLRRAVDEACRVLAHLSASDLTRTYSIQGFQESGLEAVYHVTEHFSHHAGQIILATKLLRGRSLEFTHLPGEKKRRKKARSLPAV